MAKIHVDKKQYQAHCREQVRKGLINDSDGLWKQPRDCHKMPLASESAQVRCLRYGYRLPQ